MNKMTFTRFLNNYCKRFSESGVFQLKKDERLQKSARKAGLPERPGVYIVFGKKKKREDVLYIGKAGTIQKKGTPKSRGLYRRIVKGRRSCSLRGNKFFQKKLKQNHLEALVFRWVVTFDDKGSIIPAKAEADLIQAYFDDYRRLPEWHSAF